MQQWQPNPEYIGQIVNLLKLSQSPDGSVQKQVHQQLQTLHKFPEYNKYLAFIFTKLKDEEEFVRTVAGLVLKNNVKLYYTQLSLDVRNYIKSEVVQCIGDRKTAIRRTAGTIITTIIDVTSVKEYPGLLQLFIQLLDNSDVNVVDGTLSALQKICQDSAEKLEAEDNEVGRPLQVLIPKLFTFFTAEHEAFRRFALSCINPFVFCMPSILAANMENYLKGLFHLSKDTSSEVKILVCQALITLVEVRLDHIRNYIPAVVECVLHMTTDEDEAVALEACEFWPAIAETRSCSDILRQYFPRILPALLEGMIYTDNDLAVLEAEDDDSSVPDRPQDIRPFIHHSKHEDGGDDDYDQEDWNLRKCAAAGLDIFSTEFREEILPYVLPLLSQRLQSNDDWQTKESAILAFGAIAEGCGHAMEKWLPEIIPFLLQHLSHPKPLVRGITCWTLCRFGGWIAAQQDQSKYMQPFLQQLLSRLLDPHKRVQESAISALANFEEIARARLVPYLAPILKALTTAYGKYQAKNLLILYDAIGTLADAIGSELNKPELIQILLPPLVERWNQLSDDDTRLFPLLECMTSIVIALGTGFAVYARPVYIRCLKLIEGTLGAELKRLEHIPEKDFVICSLDLVGGLVEGLKEQAEGLVKETQLFELLFHCIQHSSPDVRQSGFALIGELAKNCISVLRPCLQKYIPVLVENLQPEFHSACNNACWSIGEIAVKVGSDAQPWTMAVMQRLLPIINGRFYNRALVENAAITIGRLGLVCPQLVGPCLEEFIKPWCIALRAVRDDSEKESAFRGLCFVIRANPRSAVKHLSLIADAFASWVEPKPELNQLFGQILHAFKNSMAPNDWAIVHQQWPEGLKAILHERYQL